MRIPKNNYLSLALWALGFAAILYQCINYSGGYRLLSDLQLRLFGVYFPAVSFVTLTILLIPAMLVAPPPKQPDDEFEDGFATYEHLAMHKQQRLLARMLRWLPIAALAGAAVLLFAQARAATLPAPVRIDLATLGAAAPAVGVPVILGGAPDFEHVGTITTMGRMGEDQNALPLTGPGFDGRYRFFVDLGHSDLDARVRAAEIGRGGRMEGTLRENGLSGEMRASFERSGLRLATPHYFLGEDGPAPRDQLRALAVLLLAIAATLGLVALNCWRLIRKYRRVIAEP
jgi:hypothetical protein